jgi:PAS domain S-box-containing protein
MYLPQNKLFLIHTYLSFAVIAIALLVLCGWQCNLFILKSIWPEYIAMNPLTAINLILIAIGILMINKDSVKSSIISKIIALVVIALMLLVFANIFSFTNFKADKILFNTSLKDNQMSVSTVFNILFLAIALFFSSKRKPFYILIFQLFTFVCLSISSVYLCAYIFHLNSIIKIIGTAPMALHTSISLNLLSIALLTTKPELGFMKTFLASSIGGVITRRALPLIISIPFIVGYLSITGHRNNLYSIEFAVAILVVTTAFLCAVIMWYYGKALNRIHLEWLSTESELRLSESKFSNAFNFSGIGMGLVSIEGTWINVNESLSKLLGYTKKELIALTFQDITHPEDLSRDLSYLLRLIKGEITTYQTEKRYIHKNGKIIWISLTASIVHDENGLPKFFVTQVVDISEARSLFIELNAKNEVLTATSQDLEGKINQLEEFNRIVAHNLRGPAGSIQMLTDMVIDADSDKDRLELLDMLKKSSITLNDTLLDLMAVLEVRMSKNIPFEDCNIIEIIQKIDYMLKGEIISKKAQIITNLALSNVNYPKVYLESIFYNLISNALKYCKSGEPPIIQISSTLVNDRTHLKFKDNGLGIDLDRYSGQVFKLNKIFHKGYDSKGVGLFMTKNQIETFGGTISVESKLYYGSEFTVIL